MTELSEFYPSPDELITSELSILDCLRRNRYIKERQPRVAIDAENYYQKNKGNRSEFEFHTYLDTWHSPMTRRNFSTNRWGHVNARLTISALIEKKKKLFKNVTYCLVVCRVRTRQGGEQLTILRKFHFDVAPGGNPSQGQQVPQTHLQYCGEMFPYLGGIGCRSEQLAQMHPWLSEPRIFFWPMSLGFLIDMALHEFPDQASAKFRADSYWRGLIRKQEALILKPFYERCVEVIKNTSRENQTLADAFYTS